MSRPLSDYPESERPRERLLQEGVDALSLAEMLAILMSTGTKGKNVLTLAHELIGRFKGAAGLMAASVPELMEVKGIGKAKAITLKAAFGIARKLVVQAFHEKPEISHPQQIFDWLKDDLTQRKQEVMVAILRDAKGRLLHQEEIACGTLSEVLVHPREVFYPAVRHKAHSLIIAHNHPSGDPTPSKADLELTRVLMHAGRVMGIGLDDHLIIGSHTFFSLRKKGYMGDPNPY